MTADVSWPEILDLARDVCGESLTSVILTGERRPICASERGPWRQSAANRAALGAALEFAEGLLALESRLTIQAWFGGKKHPA